MRLLSIWTILLSVASYTAAHPGSTKSSEQKRDEMQHFHRYAARISDNLQKCAGSAEFAELGKRASSRRATIVQELRKERNIVSPDSPIGRRDDKDWEKWRGTDHNKTGQAIDESTIFASNTTCALAPQQVIGPYYVQGELLRANMKESQSGIPLHLDIQFIDTANCSPLSAKHIVDIWHCNATGVYSGVSAAGQGGLDSTWLRGVQVADSDGVVRFETIFPGHYAGRAQHIHVTTHVNYTILPNGTYTGGTDNFVGQVYFDQDLVDTVEKYSPYMSNTQPATKNAQDMLGSSGSSPGFDPIVKYTYLGSDIRDGIFAWISIGIDTSANYNSDAQPAAYWREGGGVDSGLQMGPPGGISFTGPPPTGFPPMPTRPPA